MLTKVGVGGKQVKGRPDLLFLLFLSTHTFLNSTWRLAFSDCNKKRHVTIKARDLKQLEIDIAKAKKRFGLKDDIQIKSCYEAGRDGFWIHRYLLSKGIDNLVVDSSSIEVNRRRRRQSRTGWTMRISCGF